MSEPNGHKDLMPYDEAVRRIEEQRRKSTRQTAWVIAASAVVGAAINVAARIWK